MPWTDPITETNEGIIQDEVEQALSNLQEKVRQDTAELTFQHAAIEEISCNVHIYQKNTGL
jgi:hypothetical protein